MTNRRFVLFTVFARSLAVLALCFCCEPMRTSAAESIASQNSPAPATNAALHFEVRSYVVAGSPLLPTNILASTFAPFTGPNLSLAEIVKAASALQMEYHTHGYPAVSVAFVPEQIREGTVTFNVAQTVIPQIIVAGERYLTLSNGVEIVSQPPLATPMVSTKSVASTVVTNAETTNGVPPMISSPGARATPVQMADAMAALHLKMTQLNAQARDTRVHVVSTNAGPRFEVDQYTINGNTLLTPSAIGEALTNIDGAFGTNVSFDGIQTVVTELGKAYHERGYVTVAVNVPQQKLTNATVKLEVLEGRLADIKVAGNRYFSSNNVMRSLPSLRTNMVLNGPIFNAELNRANANQDRQIYPVIGPGSLPGTSELTLNVKDRLPLHAKLEFNNQSSPGTPDMRLNGSTLYNNLWQREHSLGLQYGFSPEVYKHGGPWDFYDQPIVAYYSGFYRFPLGNPEPIANKIANNPGSFGYDEATRRFNLPPPSGQPELTFYASRATIDTGVETLPSSYIVNIPGVIQITSHEYQQDITTNEAVGFRLAAPLPEVDGIRSIFSGGLDFKIYGQSSSKTNLAIDAEQTYKADGSPDTPIISVIPIAQTATYSRLEYLPLQLDCHASLQDAFGPADWGLSLSANLWYSSSSTSVLGGTTNQPVPLNGVQALQAITGSSKSKGHWVILRPSFSQKFSVYTNWITMFRADGQWASEPVLSTEQFGAGGVNSVRGYHEGEVFGDTGWHLSLEQQTPPLVVGTVYDGAPLVVRGSVYMDYARVYLIDPLGRQGSTPLWGTGLGLDAAVGSHWRAQFLFSWPLLSAGTQSAYQPFFNFALTAQF